MAEWLKIEPHALRFGAEAAESIRAKHQQWKDDLDFQEREAIERYLNLPAPQRKIVREVIEAFSKAYPNDISGIQHEQTRNTPPTRYVYPLAFLCRHLNAT